ncbi:MAG: hypothetical protein IH623_30385 [Verrucomicrobia bacterium]|nr:hypothetical protein [Verrucomicrobiota bacterium]
MKNRKRLFAILALTSVVLFSALNVHAQNVVLFSDGFETGLARWTGFDGGLSTGFVTPDPLGSGSLVLSFSGTRFNGDMFTLSPISVSGATSVKVRFDYLGKAVVGSSPDNFGGFIGLATTLTQPSGTWIGGTLLSAVNGSGFQGIHIVDDGSWHSYEVDVTSVIQSNDWSSIYVKLEDWGGAGPAGDVFFDNISVIATFQPRVDLIKAVKPYFSNLIVGTKYQLQVSGDMSVWTNQGSPFTATNTGIVLPQYSDVGNWGGLFFRLEPSP